MKITLLFLLIGTIAMLAAFTSAPANDAGTRA
jgi:hypothetical protein